MSGGGKSSAAIPVLSQDCDVSPAASQVLGKSSSPEGPVASNVMGKSLSPGGVPCGRCESTFQSECPAGQ